MPRSRLPIPTAACKGCCRLHGGRGQAALGVQPSELREAQLCRLHIVGHVAPNTTTERKSTVTTAGCGGGGGVHWDRLADPGAGAPVQMAFRSAAACILQFHELKPTAGLHKADVLPWPHARWAPNLNARCSPADHRPRLRNSSLQAEWDTHACKPPAAPKLPLPLRHRRRRPAASCSRAYSTQAAKAPRREELRTRKGHGKQQC